MIWMTARNSAPSSRYSTASDPITTISDRALLMGWRCASRFTAPATASAAKMKNKIKCSMFVYTSRGIASHALPLTFQRNHQARNQNVGYGQRQQHLPAERHQLVIAETRQRSTHPHV